MGVCIEKEEKRSWGRQKAEAEMSRFPQTDRLPLLRNSIKPVRVSDKTSNKDRMYR